MVTSSNGQQFRITYVGGSGNDVVLTNVTPVTYFLSEGATGTFFDEDVLIANPNAVPAPITMTFFLPGGGTIVQQRIVPAQSRITVKVDEIPGLEATSPSVEVVSDNRLTLAVERTMFWDSTHYGGHTANAVSQPERKWYFAEGSQRILRHLSAARQRQQHSVEVLITYLRELDTPVTQSVLLPPFSRVTVRAGDNPALANTSFGMTADPRIRSSPSARCTSRRRPIGSGPAVTPTSARRRPRRHGSIAEGASGEFFTTFILMINPQDTPADVTLRFLLQEGAAGRDHADHSGAAAFDDQSGRRGRAHAAELVVFDGRDVERADRVRARDVLAGGGDHVR